MKVEYSGSETVVELLHAMDQQIDKEWVRERGKELAARIQAELAKSGKTDIHNEEVRMFIFHRINELVDVENRSKLTEHERQLLREYLRDAVVGLADADRELDFKSTEDVTEVLTDYFNFEYNKANPLEKAFFCAFPQIQVRLNTTQRILGISMLVFFAVYLVFLPITFVIVVWLGAYHIAPVDKLAQLWATIACIAWGTLAAQVLAFIEKIQSLKQRIAEQKILEQRKHSKT